MFSITYMNTITDISNHWAATFGPLALKGAVLVGILLVLSHLLVRASAATRHLYWVVGLCSVLLLPLLAAGLPAWNAIPVNHATPDARLLPAPRLVTAPVAPRPAPDARPAPSAQPRAAMLSAVSTLAAIPRATWLLGIWIAGMVALCAFVALGLLRLRRIERSATAPGDPAWASMLGELCDAFGVRTQPRLLQSRRAVTPMTWGLRRAVILLPAGCDDWSSERRRQVLLHELAHVRRRDCLTQWICQILCIIHWYNPLVWIAARMMRVDRERACDDEVLLAGAKASDYAGNLLEIASSLRAERSTMSMSLAMARRSQLSGRLVAVLDPHMRRLKPCRRTGFAIVVLAIALVLPLAVVTTIAQPEPPRPPVLPMPAHGNSVDLRWNDDESGTSVSFTGSIEFSDDETRIVDMDEDASFLLEQGKRSLLVEKGDDGKLVYTYREGRKEKPYDDEAAAWLAEVLPVVLASAGINSDARAARVYRESGIDGALAMADGIESDFSKGAFYGSLLGLDELRPADARAAIRHAASDIESDFMLAQLLQNYLYTGDPDTQDLAAVIEAMKEIESDFSQSQVLQVLFLDNDLDTDTMRSAMQVVTSMDSDFTKVNVLLPLSKRARTDSDVRKLYLDAAGSIDSGFERQRALSALGERI